MMGNFFKVTCPFCFCWIQWLFSLIQEAYDYPVDVEYTINVLEEGDYVINLLQCRPLQVAQDREDIEIPKELCKEKIFDYGVVNTIISIITKPIEIFRTCIFLILGVKALKQGSIAIPFVDKLIDKYY